MHDFCFTIPYGLILVAGGVIGYLKKGSTASLGGGVGTGLVLILAGYLSFKASEKRKNSYFALVLQTVIAAVLTYVMGQRYYQTSKIMPAGIVAGIRCVDLILGLFCTFMSHYIITVIIITANLLINFFFLASQDRSLSIKTNKTHIWIIIN
ncbi:hypothetical protein REPUB_Repub05bG0033100 [Reevesia pubescens]